MLPILKQGWIPSIFNDFIENDGFWKYSTTSPAINVIENENEYKIEMAAPGMAKENISVRISDDNQLVVSMEKKEEQNDEKKGGKYLRREFSYTKFEKTILLPDNIIKDHVEAKMSDGILTIQIPKEKVKLEKAKERHILIK